MENITDLEMNWKKKMADFEVRLKAASTPSNPTVLQLSQDFQAFKDLVGNMLNLLRQQLSDCTKIVDAMDMRQRQKVLLFKGIPEDPERIVQHEVLKIIGDKLGLPHISDASLKRCHRLGSQVGDRPRVVLVHFRDHHNKSEVWKAKSKLKGSNVTLCEFLTRIRLSIHTTARKHFGVKNVWSLDGTIQIKVPGGGRHKIVSEEELHSLISKFPATSSPSSSDVRSGGSGSEKEGSRAPLQSSNRVQDARRRLPLASTSSDDLKRSRRPVPKK